MTGEVKISEPELDSEIKKRLELHAQMLAKEFRGQLRRWKLYHDKLDQWNERSKSPVVMILNIEATKVVRGMDFLQPVAYPALKVHFLHLERPQSVILTAESKFNSGQSQLPCFHKTFIEAENRNAKSSTRR